MPKCEAAPNWRAIHRRIRSITIDDLRLLFDWSLPGQRIYGLSQGKRFYIVAKCDVETPEPLYPCRTSEIQNDHDKTEWNYPTGRFTTWLRTSEIKAALDRGHLVKCYEVNITIPGGLDKRRWAQLRRKVFQHYGKRCMRCGAVGEMHVDHIKPWRNYPELRYEFRNLQVLCHTCHKWKERQSKEIDFRP